MMRELNDLRGSDPALRSIRNATIEAMTYLRDATEALLQQVCESTPRAYAVRALSTAGRPVSVARMMVRSAGFAAQRLADGALAGAAAFDGLLSRQAADGALLCRASAARVPGLLRIVKAAGPAWPRLTRS